MPTPRQNLIEAAARAFFSNSEAVFPSYNRYPRYEDALCYAAEKQFGAGSPEHEYFLSATDRAYNSVLLVIERLCKEQLEFFTDQQHGPDPRPDDLDCTGCKATVSHYDCMICKPSFSPLAPSAFNSIAAPAPDPIIIEPPVTDDDTQPSAPVKLPPMITLKAAQVWQGTRLAGSPEKSGAMGMNSAAPCLQ